MKKKNDAFQGTEKLSVFLIDWSVVQIFVSILVIPIADSKL